MDNIKWRDGNPKKEQKKKLPKIKNTMTEWRMPYNGLISRLDVTEERISESEDMSIETAKIEKQREQILK